MMLEFGQPRLRRLLENRHGIGAFWLSLGSQPIVEIAAVAGGDVIVLDAQHGLWDRMAIETAVGLAGNHLPVMVRTSGNDDVSIGNALDAGAEGVFVPMIESAEAAAEAVSRAKYPPQGTRSGGGIRPIIFGFGDYVHAVEQRTVVGVMIETATGIANAEAIAAVEGVDIILIGTGDLALSLGCAPGDAVHEAACAAVLEVCCKHDKPCGVFTGDVEAAIAARVKGYLFSVIAPDVDAMVRSFNDAAARFAGAAAGALSIAEAKRHHARN